MTAEDIIQEFHALSAIPRCSGNENQVVRYISQRADEAGFPSRIDEKGNLAVFVPATQGMEDAPAIILQGHVDMVCVKDPDSAHDFSKDPVIPVLEGDWITARGTTLGADNGIAVAIELAVMKDKNMVHGPLELLFTVEEETGLIGASALGDDMIRGEYLINLDGEGDDQICIGCAGGVLITAEGTLAVKANESDGSEEWELSARGLKGGHSGVDIYGSPENLFKKMKTILQSLSEFAPGITECSGEGKINAIPTNWTISFLMHEKDGPSLLEAFQTFEKDFLDTYDNDKTNPILTLNKVSSARKNVLTDESFRALSRLIEELPAGVIEMNEDLEGQVRTSGNSGVLRVDNNGLVHLETGIRSDDPDRLTKGEKDIHRIVTGAGLSITNLVSFPPWPPISDSNLGNFCMECREGIYEEEAKFVSMHGGLECGVISIKAGNMESVSIGPNLYDVHTTRERLQISSLVRLAQWLQRILDRQKELPKKK